MTDNPKTNFSVEQVKEPLKGEIQVKEIPTVSVKKYDRTITADLGKTISSFTPSGTAHALMTYLHLETSVGTTELALADRNGTFDSFYLGTPENLSSEHRVILRGDPMNPIHAIAGSLNIYNVGGSLSDGTVITAYDLVQR